MMLDQQKDWTFKLFLHNFFKENNLKNTLQSFENEVLQTPNFNQDLPIKSNRTFLLEMWNIFFHLYSEELMKDFWFKNSMNFNKEQLHRVTFGELFKPGVFNMNQNQNLFNNMNNLFTTNPLILSTLESFKNLSRSFNNINFPFNNQGNQNFDMAGMNKGYANYSNMNSSMNPSMNNMANAQKDFYVPPKMGSDTSSISVSSGKLPKPCEVRVHHPKLFNTNISVHRTTKNETDILNKKRKRYIKNNKFVFVHPGSAAAKKMELEKLQEVDERMKEDEIIKADENEEGLSDFNVNNNSNEHESENSVKGKKPRGSRYRGVSRNGNQWQVLIMVSKKKRYVGSYSNEEEAARAYDKVALQNHGTKAKTNFDYVDEEVKRILLEPPLLKINY